MAQSEPWVLGMVNNHNGSVCLLKGDEIVVAIQEERLSRRKRHATHGSQPSLALKYCLDYAGIQPRDLNLVVNSVVGRVNSPIEDVTLNPLLQTSLHGIPVLTITHHMAHAVSAFATSGFEESAVLVVDGVGSPFEDLSEDERAAIKGPVPQGSETISLYAASGTSLVPLEKQVAEKGQWLLYQFLRMPRFRSLGAIFSAASWQIFGNYQEAGKVMGLAPYGKPTFPTEDFFDLVDGCFRFKDTIPERFDHYDRWPKRQTEYQDLSASVQVALEEALLHLASRLHDLCPSPNLCYAGGVALNSVANERILREREFKDMYVIPAAEDSGTAIGAAYYGLWQLTGRNSRRPLGHDAVGRRYSDDEIGQALAKVPKIQAVQGDDVLEQTVDMLVDGKIVGWFQGRSELGPRALGQRSILCDPRSPDAKALLNGRVKHREAFRPFAPVVPLDLAKDWFELEGFPAESPYMLRVIRFREETKERVPAVMHVDGTGRVQTVTPEANGRFHDLVQRFYARTGVPILLNTSFNVMGEPIVETPEDALWCFLSTGIDACVLGDRVVVKQPEYRSILDLYPTLVAPRYTESLLLGNGLSGEDARRASFLSFSVMTPWGRTRQVASSNVLPLLGLIDGKRNGWSLLADFPKELRPLDERFLVETLERWMKAAQGEVLIDGSIPPRAIAETLYNQRISAYDERTVIRLLVQLRRDSVIALREGPTP